MRAERAGRSVGINALFLLPGQIGGAEIYVRDLLRALALADECTTYYVYRNRETQSDIVPSQTNFVDCPQPVHANNRPARILYEQTLLVLSILEHRNDVVLNLGFTAPLLAPVPMATIIYDLQYKHHPECFGTIDLLAWKLLVPLSARRSKRVIVMSHDTRSDVEKTFPWAANKIALVPHGTDPAMVRIAAERRKRVSDPLLLCVSALRAHKNLENLVRAFARFHAIRPEFRLVVVGPRDRMAEPLEALRDELGLRDAIDFTGWIARVDLLAYFVRARALVFPSRFEGFGIPILEALTARLPIACSNIAPVRELARDAAIYFEPENITDIATAFERVIADDPSRDVRVDTGENIARAFTWSASAKALRETLLSCTSDRDNEQKSRAVASDIVRRSRVGRATLGRVLDVGCGTGTVLFAARAVASSLSGVDRRDDFINVARASLPEARILQAPAESLPFADGSFDTIFFCDVIEHLHDPVTPLREIRRVLAPGGILVLTTPNSDALSRYLLRSRWPALGDPTHVLFFTRFTLRHLLKMTGFTAYQDGTLGGSGVGLLNAVLETFGNGGTIVSISRA